MVANDSCGYEAPLGYQNESAWYLEYKSKTDSTYIFDVINKFVVDIDDIKLWDSIYTKIWGQVPDDKSYFNTPIIKTKRGR